MRNSKKLSTRKMVIFMLMLLVLTVYFVSGTYARYTWRGKATGTLNVAKWQVGLVNGEEKQATDTTINFTINGNEYVVNNKIAPSYSASADLVLNPAGSEVAIDYELDVDEGELAKLGVTFEISKVSVGGVDLVKNAEGNYIGTIELKDRAALTEAESVTVNFEATWKDDGTTAKDLTENGYGKNVDTTAGHSIESVSVPVTVYMQQHIGE